MAFNLTVDDFRQHICSMATTHLYKEILAWLEVHSHETHVYKMHAYELHAYKTHADDLHACEVHAREIHAPFRGFPGQLPLTFRR
jgi:hypothetical protein